MSVNVHSPNAETSLKRQVTTGINGRANGLQRNPFLGVDSPARGS